MPRRLMIDTDPGVDDAVAIFLALASPELDVVGLTTVFGNAEVETTTRNALRLLEIAGRGDIPVAAGTSGPLASAYHGPVPHIHGADGQGETHLPPPVAQPDDKTAVELLIEVSREPGLTVLTLGPLTNLALALRQDPGLADRLEEVVVMGGNALVPGNATPAAEANVWNDPEAADLVFGQLPRTTMVGLDVTQQVVLSGSRIAALGRVPTATAQHLAAAVPFYQAFFAKANGLDGIYLHDPTAVVYLTDPELFTTRRWPLRVDVEGIGRGKTWPSIGGTDHHDPEPWRDRPRIRICTEVRAEEVARRAYGRLTRGQEVPPRPGRPHSADVSPTLPKLPRGLR